MTYNIVFQRDAIGVKSATCSCGWSKYREWPVNYSSIDIDCAIALHEENHAAEHFPHEAGNL